MTDELLSLIQSVLTKFAGVPLRRNFTPHFGERHAEFNMVREALGKAPLIGFFAGGEIARHHLQGYTGMLTVFAGAA